MRGKREALRSREGAARFGQNKNPVTGRLQGFLLKAKTYLIKNAHHTDLSLKSVGNN